MLVDRFLESCERWPDKMAASDEFRTLSYAQLRLFSQAVRRLVLKMTDCPRVGVMLPASTASLGTILGSLWASKTVIPLNFLLPARELAEVIADARIDLIVSIRHFEPLLKEIPIRTVYLEKLPIKRTCLLEKLRPIPQAPKTDPNELAAIPYTSGSTGHPRGVCLTQNNLLSNCLAAIEHFRIEHDHHMLGILPPFHAFGLTATLFLPIVHGMSVTFIPRFSPQAVYHALAEKDISIVVAVPSMYTAIARLKTIEREKLTSVRLAFSGGEPLPERVYQEVLNRTGITLLEGYGMTEASPVISANLPWAHRVNTVGQPLPGVELQVRDANGQTLPPGEQGELCVRGPLVMKGYFNLPKETSAAIDKDGWLRTGDVVKIDEDGFISITGRAKEMMIVGGENVFPREVESVLEEHPAVAEAAVLGKRDANRGEVVVAFVILGEDKTASASEIRIFCRDLLAGHKIPREVYIVDDLPRGPTGKILKRELKAQLEQPGSTPPEPSPRKEEKSRGSDPHSDKPAAPEASR